METSQLHPGVIDKQASARAGTLPITLVFTDMVGSSAAKRSASLGGNATERDTAFLESIQSRHLHLIRECVAAHNGKEIMTIGDAFFLTFEDPRSAILCSAEIQMRLKAQPIMTANGRMQIRIGIHIGTPKYFENSWHGTDVDLAARAESALTRSDRRNRCLPQSRSGDGRSALSPARHFFTERCRGCETLGRRL